MLRGYTASSTYAAEAPALARGEPLMARAAAGLAAVVAARTPPGAAIAVFGGRGNNGADALYAAADLARRGFVVGAALTFAPDQAEGPSAGAVRAARASGVSIAGIEAAGALASEAAVWIDGLSGIGMRPPARGELAQVLTALAEHRAARTPVVFAVDLPSGLGADGGAVPGPVLPADHTVTFGGYKAAHLLAPAAHACGQLHLIDIGLGPNFAGQEPRVRRVEEGDLARWWPAPTHADHKYTRGVVGVATGSAEYPGAGVLSVAGALGAGPGMVRYLGPAAGPVLAAHPEAVTQEGRVQAWVVGSGVPGRVHGTGHVGAGLEAGMGAGVPIVLDAGGADWIDEGTIGGRPLTPRVVLTPHAGELAALLTRGGTPTTRAEVEADPARFAHAGAEATGASVVLKGAITVVSCQGALFAQADATPWMSTAGTGDVLAGILGTVLAGWQVGEETGGSRWPSLGHALAGAVAVHGLAGTLASGGGPVTASQVASHVAPVLRRVLAH